MSDDSPSTEDQTDVSVDELRAWVAETAERKGVAEQEVLDELLASYRMLDELSGGLSDSLDLEALASEQESETDDEADGLEELESDLETLRPVVEELSEGLPESSPDTGQAGSDVDPDNETSTPVGEPTDVTTPPADAQPAGKREFEELLENVDMFGQTAASSQVLIVSPGGHTITNEVLAHFLTSERTTDQNILFVSTKEAADKQLPVVADIATWTSGETALVEVGNTGFDATSSAESDAVREQFDVHRTVSNPSNIAKLGVVITQIVSQLGASDTATVLGFHTLSLPQQFVGTQTLFQFLYTLHSQLESADIRGYYHVDSLAHDEREMATLTSLFDLVVRVSPDGSVDIE